MKRKRFLPNGVRSAEIRAINYAFFSVPTGGGSVMHLIDRAENFRLLKQKYPKIRKVKYIGQANSFTFFDELTNKAYLLKRKQLQDHTIPITTTELETPFKCGATRSGMVRIQPLPR